MNNIIFVFYCIILKIVYLKNKFLIKFIIFYKKLKKWSWNENNNFIDIFH